MAKDHLSHLYESYLKANLAPSAAAPLVNALHQAGLSDKATALQVYIEHGPGTSYTIEDGVWRSRRCLVSDCRPEESDPGTLWFDVTELTHMIDIYNGRSSSWLAVHPVYVWQFKAFLALVDWRRMREFPVPDDLLLRSRFDNKDELLFATDVYQEEAAAYSLWYLKFLSSIVTLRDAHVFLPDEAYESLMPSDMLLWDTDPGEPDNEIYRKAYGFAEPDIDIRDCIVKLRRDEYASPKDVPGNPRRFYSVWERSQYIGLNTKILENSRLMKGKLPEVPESGWPVCWYEVAIRNFAPRPSLGIHL